MIQILLLSILFFQPIHYMHFLRHHAETSFEWTVSTPEAQGMDGRKIDSLLKKIEDGRTYPGVDGLLIVRNGVLVTEAYFHVYNRDRLHTLQSVTKSFTSAAIGIAIDRGLIAGVNEKVLDFFTDIEEIENRDARKESMRLVHILTMRTGTDYREGYTGSPHDILNHKSRGWDRFYLNRPMTFTPGQGWQYDSGGVILLSAILKRKAGMHADKFMDKYLFGPLDISKTFWFRNKEGHPHTGGGLFLLPRDMAKFGLLYLQGGRWNGEQVVPESWVSDSFEISWTFPEVPGNHNVGYGYLWWILEPDPAGDGIRYIYAARGAMGQYIFIIPEHDMVVVATGNSKDSRISRAATDFLYSDILPSVLE